MKSKGNMTKPTFSPDSALPIRAGDFLRVVEVGTSCKLQVLIAVVLFFLYLVFIYILSLG